MGSVWKWGEDLGLKECRLRIEEHDEFSDLLGTLVGINSAGLVVDFAEADLLALFLWQHLCDRKAEFFKLREDDNDCDFERDLLR